MTDTLRSEAHVPGVLSRGLIRVFMTVSGGISNGVRVSAAMPRTYDNRIGQLPTGATRAFVVLRDAYVAAAPNGTLTTPPRLVGVIEYQDPAGYAHALVPVDSGSLAADAIIGYQSDTPLIVASPLADAQPGDLGTLRCYADLYDPGTATSIGLTVVVNVAFQYL